MKASQYNKKNADWGIDTTDFKFHTLKELAEIMKKNKASDCPIYGMYINSKGKFDDHPVLIIEDALVDAPPHLTEQVREMLKDAEVIEDIKSGKVGITIREYEDKKFSRGTCYSLDFIDYD